MSQLGRRRLDDISMNIETMIAEEDDPKQRAFLIVLNSINNSLLANTVTVRDIGGKLDSHLYKYEENVKASEQMLNRGKGMWTVFAWVMALAQAAVISTGAWAASELASIHNSIHEAQMHTIKLDARVHAVEQKVFGP